MGLPSGGDGQYTNGACFPAGTVIEFDNMSLVDKTTDQNDYVQEPPFERSRYLSIRSVIFRAWKRLPCSFLILLRLYL